MKKWVYTKTHGARAYQGENKHDSGISSAESFFDKILLNLMLLMEPVSKDKLLSEKYSLGQN